MGIVVVVVVVVVVMAVVMLGDFPVVESATTWGLEREKRGVGSGG